MKRVTLNNLTFIVCLFTLSEICFAVNPECRLCFQVNRFSVKSIELSLDSSDTLNGFFSKSHFDSYSSGYEHISFHLSEEVIHSVAAKFDSDDVLFASQVIEEDGGGKVAVIFYKPPNKYWEVDGRGHKYDRSFKGKKGSSFFGSDDHGPENHAFVPMIMKDSGLTKTEIELNFFMALMLEKGDWVVSYRNDWANKLAILESSRTGNGLRSSIGYNLLHILLGVQGLVIHNPLDKVMEHFYGNKIERLLFLMKETTQGDILPLSLLARLGNKDMVHHFFANFLLEFPLEVAKAAESDDWTWLQHAAYGGKLETFISLLDKMKDSGVSELLDKRDRNQWNLLHYAAANNGFDMVQYLAELKKEFLREIDDECCSPLDRAIISNTDTRVSTCLYQLSPTDIQEGYKGKISSLLGMAEDENLARKNVEEINMVSGGGKGGVWPSALLGLISKIRGWRMYDLRIPRKQQDDEVVLFDITTSRSSRGLETPASTSSEGPAFINVNKREQENMGYMQDVL